MNLRTSVTRTVLGLVGAAAITASVAAPALADNSVTQQINSNGTFSASIADGSMQTVQYSNSAQTTDGSLTLTASDGRGTAAGWNVTVESGDFIYSGASTIGQDIPDENFTIDAVADPGLSAGQAVGVAGPFKDGTSGVGTLDSARKTIFANAGGGSGVYTQVLDVGLVVPAYSQAGTYTATLTVTIATGP